MVSKSSSVFIRGMIFLVIGLLGIKQMVIFTPIWVAATIVITLLFFAQLERDKKTFLLLLFMLSHFTYAENQGGLWTICAFFAYMLSYVFNSNRKVASVTVDAAVMLSLGLFACNVIGWCFFSEAAVLLRFQGFIMLSTYILTFIIASNLDISDAFWRSFISLCSALSIYLFVVALNQRFGFLDSTLPLFPPKAVVDGEIKLTSNSNGVFGNSELYGEYSVLMLLLLVSALRVNAQSNYSYLRKWQHNLAIFTSGAGVFLSGSRASVFLLALVIAYLSVKSIFKMSVSRSLLGTAVITFIGWMSMALINPETGLQSTMDDMRSLSGNELSLGGLISGESINRHGTFICALDRLNDESWIFGRGLGPLAANTLAWWGDIEEPPYVDFHNLYYTMPMVFGYSGMLCFLSLILVVVFRSMASYKNPSSLQGAIIANMPLFWLVFLMDEWKISMLRDPNYQMLIWIFLGINTALIKHSSGKHKR